MNKEKKRYKLTILGESYSLVSDESEEIILRAGRLVDQRITDITQALQSVDHKKASILVALQLASELLLLQSDCERQVLKNQALADLIEQVVGSSPTQMQVE